MQDQPADSSDLTTDEDAALVPEGKTARRRHRMPRQKLRPAPVDGVDAPPEPEAEPEAAVEAETPAEAEPTPEPIAEPEPEPETRRSRFPWRRAKTDAPAPAAVEPEPEPTESASATVDSETAEAAESESEPPTRTMVPHRPAGRRLKIAAIVAGGLFVAASAFAGATLQPYLVDRAEVQTKLDVARTAQAAITTLWTYTPEDMEKLDDRAAKYLGGDFAKDYKDYIARIVEANKQAQISNSTQVLGAAVESLTPTEATAIIYTNSVATSPVTKGIPSLRYLSYRLQLERRDGRWLITTMTAVTSLDLTPRL